MGLAVPRIPLGALQARRTAMLQGEPSPSLHFSNLDTADRRAQIICDSNHNRPNGFLLLESSQPHAPLCASGVASS